MSADPNPIAGADARARDTRPPMGAADVSRRSLSCVGCGQRPDDLTALDAIALTAVLEQRCAWLLAHPEAVLRHRGPKSGSWSALDPVIHVADVLASVDRRLCDLLGEETWPEPPPLTQGVGSIMAILADNIRHLIGTLGGATTQDWYRPRPDNGATAGQMVWLALHDATHHVEDAELILDASSAPHPTGRNQPDQASARLTLL